MGEYLNRCYASSYKEHITLNSESNGRILNDIAANFKKTK